MAIYYSRRCTVRRGAHVGGGERSPALWVQRDNYVLGPSFSWELTRAGLVWSTPDGVRFSAHGLRSTAWTAGSVMFLGGRPS